LSLHLYAHDSSCDEVFCTLQVRQSLSLYLNTAEKVRVKVTRGAVTVADRTIWQNKIERVPISLITDSKIDELSPKICYFVNQLVGGFYQVLTFLCKTAEDSRKLVNACQYRMNSLGAYKAHSQWLDGDASLIANTKSLSPNTAKRKSFSLSPKLRTKRNRDVAMKLKSRQLQFEDNMTDVADTKEPYAPASIDMSKRLLPEVPVEQENKENCTRAARRSQSVSSATINGDNTLNSITGRNTPPDSPKPRIKAESLTNHKPMIPTTTDHRPPTQTPSSPTHLKPPLSPKPLHRSYQSLVGNISQKTSNGSPNSLPPQPQSPTQRVRRLSNNSLPKRLIIDELPVRSTGVKIGPTSPVMERKLSTLEVKLVDSTHSDYELIRNGSPSSKNAGENLQPEDPIYQNQG